MKRIVIDNRLSGTTTGRYSDKLIEYLHKLQPNYEVVVLTRTPQVEFVKSIAPNFKVIESNWKDFSFGEQLGLGWQLLKLKADLVHFPIVQQPILYYRPKVTSMLDLTTMRFIDPSKNRIIFTIKQRVYILVNHIAARTSRHIITISNFVRDELITMFHLKPDKVTTTYNAADKIPDNAEPVKQLVGRQFIFYTGRPLPHKNLPRLIDAFGILQKDYPDLVLVLAGKKTGPYLQIEKDVAKRGLKNIIFTDFISEGELRWMYENTTAYIFPSLSEGFGLPGLEAMVHGAPVASSNASCLPEIYGDAALYFDPLDINDMATKISQLISSKSLQEKLIAKGHEQTKKYSWQRMAEQTLEIYKKALKD